MKVNKNSKVLKGNTPFKHMKIAIFLYVRIVCYSNLLLLYDLCKN